MGAPNSQLTVFWPVICYLLTPLVPSLNKVLEKSGGKLECPIFEMLSNKQRSKTTLDSPLDSVRAKLNSLLNCQNFHFHAEIYIHFFTLCFF